MTGPTVKRCMCCMFAGILCSLNRGRWHPCLERTHKLKRHPPLSNFVCFLIDSLAVMNSFTAFRTRYSGASIGNKAVTILLLAFKSFIDLDLSTQKHRKWEANRNSDAYEYGEQQFQRISIVPRSQLAETQLYKRKWPSYERPEFEQRSARAIDLIPQY